MEREGIAEEIVPMQVGDVQQLQIVGNNFSVSDSTATTMMTAAASRDQCGWDVEGGVWVLLGRSGGLCKC